MSRGLLAVSLALAGAVTIAGIPSEAEPLDLDSDEFPIGIYSADSNGAMAQVKEMGVTYVHTYGMGRDATPEGIKKDLAYMDLAHKHGLKVMAYLNGRQWVGNRGLLDMHKLVVALKDHPAMGFWLFYDEPSGKHTVEELMPYYWIMKYEAPEVPIAVVEAWKKDWYKYAQVCDILQLDNYPVKDEPFPGSPLGNVTEFVGRGVKLEDAVIMPVLQCMNWKGLKGYMAQRVDDVEKLRYPTAAELHYWSYSSLAQGVRGLFWWSYYQSVQCGYPWINSEFKQAMLEVRQFVDLVAPAHKPVIFQYAPDEKVYMAVWRRPAGNFLVVANGQPIARKIRRGNEGLIADEATLRPWGHTRESDAAVAGGVFTVHAQPWETFIWELEEAEGAG